MTTVPVIPTVDSTAVDTATAVQAKTGKTKPAVKAKRKYTARGTTVVARRVTLLDGKVIGRGKPAKATKGLRTVVYVPVGQDYNPTVHGLGVKFTPGLVQFRKVFKRIKIADLGKVYNLNAAEASAEVSAPATEAVSAAVESVA